MKNLDETQINYIQDMLKTEGWKIYKELIDEQVTLLRKNATQYGVEVEKRTWNSGEASGMEKALSLPTNYIE